MNSWGHPMTIISLALAVVLLSTFAFVESRVEHPLLPLRVVADRVRGGSYLAIGISGTALFAVFLFLTYYLQQTKGFSPIETGLAYLPMTAAIIDHRDLGEHQVPRQDRAAPAARPRHDARRAGDGVVRAARDHVELRRPRPARPDRDGHRDGQHLRAGDLERDLRRRSRRHRRRLGDGQHDAAGRRVDRHRAAQLDLRERGDLVRRGQAAEPAGRRRRRDARLHRRLLGRGRHLRLRRGRGRHADALGQARSRTRRASPPASRPWRTRSSRLGRRREAAARRRGARRSWPPAGPRPRA